MDASLVPLLESSKVPLAKIEKDYACETAVVRELLGLVPIADEYMEIWPTAFRTYNLLVPNCFNVPFAMMHMGPGGGQAAELQGAAMFAVSKAAECSYCTAHTCSWALRRGTSPEMLDAGWRNKGGSVGEAERATFAVARALGKVPTRLSGEERGALVAAVGEPVAELLVWSMCGMGYLNKAMDALGMPLEQGCFAEVQDYVGTDMDVVGSKAGAKLDTAAPAGKPPKDSWFSNLKILLKVPGALIGEMRITKGVPNTWPEAGEHLRAKMGYNFPFLSAISTSFHGKRVVTALTKALADNYDVEASAMTVPVKVLAGAVFAEVAESPLLAEQFSELAAVFSVGDDLLKAAQELGRLQPAALGSKVAKLPGAFKAMPQSSQSLLLLARWLAPTPARVSPELVEALGEAEVPPECIVELVSFLGLAQLQLRFSAFYPHKAL